MKVSAIKRLNTELALSKVNIKKGNPLNDEAYIVEVWRKYYAAVFDSMTDIPVEGAGPSLTNVIGQAKKIN